MKLAFMQEPAGMFLQCRRDFLARHFFHRILPGTCMRALFTP
jgi:hypothetical protein